MKLSKSLLFAVSLSTALATGAAHAQIKIGAMVSATGPTSAIGIPQRNTVALLPTTVGGLTIEYITLDDGGDTTRAVQNAKQLIQQHKVDAIIGPSTTPAALAILPIIAEAKVPLVSTVGSQAVVEPQDATKRWVFKTTQNDDLIAEALVSHMVRNKVKRLGYVGFNDPFGEGFLKILPAMLAKNKIELVATEKYSRTDQSVTGQALKLIAAKPDAVFVAAVGGPAVLPQATLRDQGFKGTIYQTHAIATQDFIKIGGAKVEGTVLAAGGMLVFDEMSDANPVKNVAARFIRAYEKIYGTRPATFGANTYDSGILLQYAIPDALKKGQPGSEAFRSALRDALEGQKEIVGCQGVFNVTASNHNGLDKRARELITIKDGKFRLLGDTKVTL
jgi:branched-chain amino acid transport system substrate-binding protein